MSTRRELDAAYARLTDVVSAYLGGTATYRSLGDAFDKVRALQVDLNGDAPANATDTSIAAAKSLPAGGIRFKVLSTVYLQWKMVGVGMTADAVENRLARPHTSVSSAINYLAARGLLEDSGARAKTRQGRMAIQWRPTELAERLILERAVEMTGGQDS